jgi:hypothetical protein
MVVVYLGGEYPHITNTHASVVSYCPLWKKQPKPIIFKKRDWFLIGTGGVMKTMILYNFNHEDKTFLIKNVCHFQELDNPNVMTVLILSSL